MITEKHIKDAESFPTLGPSYMCSRDVVERAMATIQSNDFKPLIEQFSKEFTNVVWQQIEQHLLGDTEMNLHGAVYRMVDDCVEALLSGKEWALQKYVPAVGKYDRMEIIKAIAAAIPADIQDARIAQLEETVRRLSFDLEVYRAR